MTFIADFQLPSQSNTVIRLREPTVQDCIDFAGLREEFEEQSTTKYLNQLQPSPINDSKYWTAEDRRTALWWIWININEVGSTTAISYKYDCQHCEKEHAHNVDMRELDHGVKMFQKLPVEGFSYLDNDDKTVKYSVKPLNGLAVEYLELLRFNRLEVEPESDKYKQLSAEIRVAEIACVMEFDDELERELEGDALPFNDKIDARLKRLMSLPISSKFAHIANDVTLALADLRHGLDCTITDGQIRLILPPHHCPTHLEKHSTANVKEGTALVTTLYAPFHYNFYFAAI